jgi:SAM-dependent methyltransferase
MRTHVEPDPVSEHNRRFWDRWARAGGEYTRPVGSLPKSAAGVRRLIDPRQRLKDVRLRGARVLALAAGGGWDAVGFVRLGASVTLLDISGRQLATVRDLARRILSRAERSALDIVQGDMKKDLRALPDASFDVVWHCGSLMFVDDVEAVLSQIGRTLARSGTYVTAIMHPATMRLYGTWTGTGWNPRPYPGDTLTPTEPWTLHGRAYGRTIEHAHTVETLVNALASSRMVVDGLWELSRWEAELTRPPRRPEPGSDEHLETLFPALVEVRARKLPWPAADRRAGS